MIEVYGFHGQRVSFESKALRESAHDATCQNCGIQDGTIVWAHSNEDNHGKGKGKRAHDCFGAHLCGVCHAYIDRQTKHDRQELYHDNPVDRRECFTEAMHRTWLWLFITGKLKVAP